MPEKKGKRKLPKKSKRAKRRYILFSADCGSEKQAFDLVFGPFSLRERRELGLWFIGFDPATERGVLRFRQGGDARVREALSSVEGLEALKISGTLKALKG